eukprot:19281-Heterococcus_DN1.PRE.1
MNMVATEVSTADCMCCRQPTFLSYLCIAQQMHAAAALSADVIVHIECCTCILCLHQQPAIQAVAQSVNPRLSAVFKKVEESGKAAFIPYLTAGYPKKDDTVDLLLGLQEGGADVIELGVPFTDPQADGATIQRTNQVALKNNIRLKDCLAFIKESVATHEDVPAMPYKGACIMRPLQHKAKAGIWCTVQALKCICKQPCARSQGLTTPVVLMGYLNPFLAYGLDDLMKDVREAGGDGFIVVDLLPDEAGEFVQKCRASELSFIPLVSPTTTDDVSALTVSILQCCANAYAALCMQVVQRRHGFTAFVTVISLNDCLLLLLLQPVSPVASNERMPYVASAADTFIYCVSVTGVTGARTGLPDDLKEFIARIRAKTDKPLAVGFGISQPEHVSAVGELADAAVCGSAIMNAIDQLKQQAGTVDVRCPNTHGKCNVSNATHTTMLATILQVSADASSADKRAHIREFTKSLTKDLKNDQLTYKHTGIKDTVAGSNRSCQRAAVCLVRASNKQPQYTEQALTYAGKVYANTDMTSAYFGEFGGRYIPETLVEAHRELEEAYAAAQADPAFQAEVDWYRKEYIGGPTVMYHAKRLSEELGGAQIWLKREELAHTGAHKINNAVGQALLAKRIGKKRIIAETGAGQHGVATATVCALLGMECIVYMGEVDCERQKLNVFRMNMLGAKVVPVSSGSRTLKDAINEAMRDWHKLLSSHHDIYEISGTHFSILSISHAISP